MSGPVIRMPDDERKNRTVMQIGEAEPGCDQFIRYRRRQGSTEESLRQYTSFLGSVRKLSDRPILELDKAGLETLDERLLKRAKVLRTVVKMFLRANGRRDVDDVFPRQRRPAKRNLGVDDILMPSDVMALISQATSLRDRALLAVLASTGGRVNEILGLRIRDVKQSNGGYQVWFGVTKVKSQERYSPKIEGAFKSHLDSWLAAHPLRHDKESWLFPSTVSIGQPVTDGTVNILLHSLARKAGIEKATNAHAFRHARISWAVINGEDPLKASIAFWGKPVSSMWNRYAHVSGLEMAIESPKDIELPDVPALPVPPILATQAQVGELTAKVERLERLNKEAVALAQDPRSQSLVDFFRSLVEDRAKAEAFKAFVGALIEREDTDAAAKAITNLRFKSEQ